ncbi:MAG TPA: MBL fold metallo-hydrolase [Candidatus Limnocylindria bacterium]|nr:MBL fold metallo-hydrolase [Candidatus Limnocylindria bacterium]
MSTDASARFVRQAIQETARSIAPSKNKPTPLNWSDREINVAWLGHATVLVNFYGLTILTDPTFFPRIGADIGFATIGPKRIVAAPLSLEELPPIDLLLLSHAHMDHFDMPTLREFSSAPKAITAGSTLDLFENMKFRKNVSELRWNESTMVKTAHGDVRVEAFEVNHWGARWRHDKQRGFNGYILEREGKKIMFGGDTAITDKFQLIRSKGRFDLAIMPIGSYLPFKKCHCTPEESVKMLNDAGAKKVLPVHFKTFRLGEEGTTQPMERLEASIAHDRIALRDIGETFRLT